MQSDIILFNALKPETFQVDADDDVKRLKGYMIRWADQYDLPWMSLKFDPKAFDKYFADGGETKMLLDHRDGQVISSTAGGGVKKLKANNEGMPFEATLNNTTYANDAYEMVSNGDMDGVSMGVLIGRREYADGAGKDGNDLVTVLEAELREFSVVSWPAFKDTDVSSYGDKESSVIRLNDGIVTQLEEDAKARFEQYARLRLANAQLAMAGMEPASLNP